MIPFRDPLQQAFSLFSQHKRFVKKANEDSFVRQYMDWIGHSEFGLDYKMLHSSNLQYPGDMQLNHWLEQWYLTYKSILALSAKHEEFYLIGYKSLCTNPNVWIEVKKLLDIDQGVQFSFKEIKNVTDQEFDNNLYDECYDIYESLITKSFFI